MTDRISINEINSKTRAKLVFQEDFCPVKADVNQQISGGRGVSYFQEYQEKLINRIQRNRIEKRNFHIRQSIGLGLMLLFLALLFAKSDSSLEKGELIISYIMAALFVVCFISEIIGYITAGVTAKALTQVALKGHLRVREYKINEKFVYYMDNFEDVPEPEYFLTANELTIKVSKNDFDKSTEGEILTAAEMILVDEEDKKYNRFFCVIDISSVA